MIHCSRALRSIVGSLRRRACSAVIWLLTIGSSTGLISLPRLTLTPAMLVPASLKSSRPARLGSIRHTDVSCGRDVITTLPRKSVRWSSVLTARSSICLPTALPPSRLPIAPPMPPTALPAVLPIWPVMRTLPLSGVVIVSVFDCPEATIVPRVTVSPISA